MTKMFALFAALLLGTIALSAAFASNFSAGLQFTIEPSRTSGEIHVDFRHDSDGHHNNWSSDFRPAELSGLDMAALNGPATRPIRFALIREAGRVDCAGSGGNRMARGDCTVAPDAAFTADLKRRGIGSPTQEESFGMIAINVRRALVDALSAYRYPTPSVDNLIALTAIGVTPDYIHGLGTAGYRPESIDGLVQFGALKITPDYIRGFVSAGYGDLKADELVQFRALNITAGYIAGFQRLGYGRLPADTLVQLKALDITPDYVRAVAGSGGLPSPDHLVQLRALGQDYRRH